MTTHNLSVLKLSELKRTINKAYLEIETSQDIKVIEWQALIIKCCADELLRRLKEEE